jgi:hypothetical protein
VPYWVTEKNPLILLNWPPHRVQVGQVGTG